VFGVVVEELWAEAVFCTFWAAGCQFSWVGCDGDGRFTPDDSIGPLFVTNAARILSTVSWVPFPRGTWRRTSKRAVLSPLVVGIRRHPGLIALAFIDVVSHGVISFRDISFSSLNFFCLSGPCGIFSKMIGSKCAGGSRYDEWSPGGVLHQS
jgi:hypothetical protein